MKSLPCLLLLLAASASSLACDDHDHRAAPRAVARLSAPIHATVREVDAERRSVALAHGPIPSLRMKRMQSMVVKVDPEISLDGIKPGDAVRFRVKVVDGLTSVSEIGPR